MAPLTGDLVFPFYSFLNFITKLIAMANRSSVLVNLKYASGCIPAINTGVVIATILEIIPNKVKKAPTTINIIGNLIIIYK